MTQPIDLAPFATGLEFRDGIHIAKTAAPISYPAQGNDECFQLEEGSFWFAHRNDCILAAVRRWGAGGGPFFDVGGGNDFVARHLSVNGIPAVLVEPGAEGCRNARSRGLSTIVCATLEGAGFRPGSLPSVGLFDVVEHVDDDLSFLKTVHASLRPGGLTYLTVPAYRWLWSDEDVAAGHFRRHTTRSIRSVLGRAGFSIEWTSHLFTFLPLPIFFARTLPSLVGAKREMADLSKFQREHARPAPGQGLLLKKTLAAELAAVASGLRLPVGSSILAVARRPEN